MSDDACKDEKFPVKRNCIVGSFLLHIFIIIHYISTMVYIPSKNVHMCISKFIIACTQLSFLLLNIFLPFNLSMMKLFCTRFNKYRL